MTRLAWPHGERAWVAVGLAAGLLAITALGAFLLGTGMSASSVAPATPPGWSPVFVNSFTGPARSGPGPAWKADTGTQYQQPGCPGSWGTGEVDSDTASAANVSRNGTGDLDLTVLSSAQGWTSARIETVSDSFAAPPGGRLMVTASIRQPGAASALGYWPAFWMLGASFRLRGAGTAGAMACSNWPATGSIDIMEDVNGLPEVSGTLHCGSSPGGPCRETDGLSSGFHLCASCRAKFNSYSLVIDRSTAGRESVTWYLNQAAYYRITEAQVGTAAWQTAVDHGFILILDLAVGGGYPDAVCHCTAPSSSTASGASMSVGYVAAYQSGGAARP